MNKRTNEQLCWTSLQSDQHAARMSRVSSRYQSISAAGAGPQRQTRLPLLLLLIDGTDRRTDGRILNRVMTVTAYYVDRVIHRVTVT